MAAPGANNDRYYYPYGGGRDDDNGYYGDDTAQVSPPDLAYHVLPSTSSRQQSHHHQQQQPTSTSIPQRVGTVSSGGKFSVSPASSIHEDELEDEYRTYGYGYGGMGSVGLSSPSPPFTRDMTATATSRGGGWRGTGAGAGGGGGEGEVEGEGMAGRWPNMGSSDRDIPVAPPQAPGLWDVRPDPSDIPLPAPQPWRGSRELQELANARAREAASGRGPVRTSYGPAPRGGSVSAPHVSAPAPVFLAPAAATAAAANEISPGVVSSVPWQLEGAQTPAGRQNRNQGQGVRSGSNGNGGSGPFMHYEDIDYFGPAPESEPKDESQVDGGVLRADTFPAIPEGMNRPKARRSWDRQRKRRRKKMASDAGTGDERGKERGRGWLGAAWRYCAHWLPEISCCLLALGCFAAIVAVLKSYDGRGLPDWPMAVSLNTVVAFLTAVCQVALAVPLTEGLSQLKWNSFARGEKPLADFQTFEDAKRGPIGSAVLLYRRKGRALGMSAATALLTAFLLSPLTQSAITYPTRSFEAGSGTATVARSESYSHPEPYATLNGKLDTREKQAIQSGIYHPVSQELPHLQPVCSSGDCQWRNFSSLAVCAAVADVSDRLTVTRPASRFTASSSPDSDGGPLFNTSLPNGLYLLGSATGYSLNISWPRGQEEQEGEEESFLPSRTSVAFSERDGRVASAIADFFIVYTTATINGTAATAGSPSDSQSQSRRRRRQQQQQEGESDLFRAAEVLLHFCVNTYQVSTSRGVASSRVVHTSTIVTAQEEGDNGAVRVRPRWGEKKREKKLINKARDGAVLLRLASERQQQQVEEKQEGDLRPAGVYSVKRDDVRLLNGYLLSVFSGAYSSRDGGETPTSEALGAAMFRPGEAEGETGLQEEELRDVVRNLTSNVAVGLSNAIRAMSSTSETGVVLATESHVHIRWAWLSFLAIQVVLSVSFLLGIMIQTAVWKVQILKGSPTAALLAISAEDKAYLEEREHVFLGSSRGSEQSEGAKHKLQAITGRFTTRDGGWSLRLRKKDEG